MKRAKIMMVLVALSASAAAFAADPMGPATAPGTAAASRPADDIEKDLMSISIELKDKVGPPSVLFDAAKRKDLAAVAIPLFKKYVAVLTEFAAAKPDEAGDANDEIAAAKNYLALMDDADTTRELKDAAKGESAAAVSAKLGFGVVEWCNANKDAAAQGKVLDKITDIAKAHPTNDTVAETLMLLSHTNAANEDLASRATDIISSTLTGKAAGEMKTELQAEAKLAANVGKPLVIAGKTPDGKAFTTADWKGKVVLVDFWATWCGPCIAELPRVKKAYKDFHAKGFEILGVSNDYDVDDLTKFVADAAGDMPWPNLFDPAAAKEQNWNPITLGFGINGIPTMFLIDKKGILRSVTAREDFETAIPKLLEEK